MKRLSLRLIKSDNNCLSYYLNSITVVLYFLYMSSYQMKRLSLRLIKSDNNCLSYYLNSITVVLYFLYMSSYQMNFQFKNFQKF